MDQHAPAAATPQPGPTQDIAQTPQRFPFPVNGAAGGGDGSLWSRLTENQFFAAVGRFDHSHDMAMLTSCSP